MTTVRHGCRWAKGCARAFTVERAGDGGQWVLACAVPCICHNVAKDRNGLAVAPYPAGAPSWTVRGKQARDLYDCIRLKQRQAPRAGVKALAWLAITLRSPDGFQTSDAHRLPSGWARPRSVRGKSSPGRLDPSCGQRRSAGHRFPRLVRGIELQRPDAINPEQIDQAIDADQRVGAIRAQKVGRCVTNQDF